MADDRLILPLREPVQAHAAIERAWKHTKGWLVAGGGPLVLEIRPQRRSELQNRLLHALLADTAEEIEWAGRHRNVEVWKRLLTAAWCRARGEPVEVLPALDGHGIDIVFRRTSQLTRGECAELCDYIMSWMADNDVPIRAGQHWRDAA